MFKPKADMLKEILGSIGKKDKPEADAPVSKDEPEVGEGEGDAGKEAAADDVISAIQSRDARALAVALEAFFAMC